MTAPLPIAIVGAGDVVRRFYLPHVAEAPGLTICGLLSRGAESARRVAAAASIERVYETLDELLADTVVRGVVVCVPPSTQHSIVTKALATGRHVLVEKPVCASEAELEDLIARARAGPGTLHMTFNNRFREENVALCEAARGDGIGEPVSIQLEWLRRKPRPTVGWWTDPAQAIGGVFADLGSHLVAILLEMLPRRRRYRLSAELRRGASAPVGIEDQAQVLLWVDEIMVTIQAGWDLALARGSSVSLRVVGTAAERTSGDYDGPRSDGYAQVLARFTDSAAAGRSSDLALARDTMRIVHAVYRSAARGAPVEGVFGPLEVDW